MAKRRGDVIEVTWASSRLVLIVNGEYIHISKRTALWLAHELIGWLRHGMWVSQ